MGSVGHMIGTDWNWNGSVKTYLDRYHTQLHGPVLYRVLASATRGGVYYAAIERVSVGSGQRDVIAAVQPYKFYGKGYNRELVVKDQDETMGPHDVDCPAKILNLLTEPLSDEAAAWRERVRENLTKQATKQTVKVGDTLLFSAPFSFGSYGQTDTFQVKEWGRRKRFYAMMEDGNHFLCRLQRYCFTREFVVIGAD